MPVLFQIGLLQVQVVPFNFDEAGMIAALGVAEQLIARLSAISGAARGAAASVRGINVPQLGNVLRSHFKVGGIGGGD